MTPGFALWSQGNGWMKVPILGKRSMQGVGKYPLRKVCVHSEMLQLPAVHSRVLCRKQLSCLRVWSSEARRAHTGPSTPAM